MLRLSRLFSLPAEVKSSLPSTLYWACQIPMLQESQIHPPCLHARHAVAPCLKTSWMPTSSTRDNCRNTLVTAAVGGREIISTTNICRARESEDQATILIPMMPRGEVS